MVPRARSPLRRTPNTTHRPDSFTRGDDVGPGDTLPESRDCVFIGQMEKILEKRCVDDLGSPVSDLSKLTQSLCRLFSSEEQDESAPACM
jgi:hypothetical protein